MDAYIVKKVASGSDKPEAKDELPIDVHYQDLLDFLITRQRLPKDWLQRIQAIHAKGIEAIKTTPPHALKAADQIASHMEIDYSKALAIRDALAATNERTIFGGLQGPAATWDKIVRAYQTKSVFLGESAQSLVQLISYDIPAYRKQLVRLDAQVAEAERKQAESLKSAAQSATAFEAECRKLGFNHRSPIRSSLKGLSSEIPTILQSAMAGLQSEDLARAASYYSDFVSFAHDCEASVVLPILREVLKGQTSLPSHLNDLITGLKEDTSPVLDIDWGIGLEGDEGPKLDLDVDWGLEGSTQEMEVVTAPAEISWDVDLDVSADAAGIDGGSHPEGDITAAFGIEMEAALEVDWDIGMDPGPNENQGDQIVTVSNEQDCCNSSSSSTVIKRLELDTEYRNRLLDDILELKSFLIQRRAELKRVGNQMVFLTGSCSDLVKSIDSVVSIDHLASAVDTALASLTNERLKQLLLIKGSKRYFERLAAGLERRALQESRLLAAGKDAETRGREARQALASIQPKINEAVASVKAIRQSTQEAMSALFGRRVNILGANVG